MSDIIYLDPEDPRRLGFTPDPPEPTPLLGIVWAEGELAYVEGEMPMKLALAMLRIVERYTAGEDIENV